MSAPKKLAILVGGGPAPGINSVISAAAIRAKLAGLEVKGIYDGYSWLMQGNLDHIEDLTIDKVSQLHFQGGSYLRTARANPTRKVEHLDNVVASLEKLGVDKLVTIGGDDTAFSAMSVAKHAKGKLSVVHVPKTIDNDLDLPLSIPTFGYETARHVGAHIVRDLIADATTTSRWYFVVAMGRKAGHLALGIGKSAGATVTLIPEEYSGKHIPLDEIVDTLVGSIVKRRAQGHHNGVAVLAEGLVERLDPKEATALEGAEVDEHGHLRIAEIPFGMIIKRLVEKKLDELGLKTTIVEKNIGYELRSTAPIPFDMEYTRDLGYCAAKFLLSGGSGAMVTIQNGLFMPIPFEKMLDPETGHTRVRLVNVETEAYKIARRYMIRIRRDDFSDPAKIRALSSVTSLDEATFRQRFEYLVDSEPPPLEFRNWPTA